MLYEYNVILENIMIGKIITSEYNLPQLEKILYFNYNENYCIVEICDRDLTVIFPKLIELNDKISNGNFMNCSWWRENNV